MMWQSGKRVLRLASLVAVAAVIMPTGAQSPGLAVVPGAAGFGMTTRAA
jgi:hypothetical protein